MFKKFVLSAVCVAMTAALYAGQVKVDHSSKEKLVESLIYSIIYDDSDAFWEIIVPSFRQAVPKNQENELKKNVFYNFKNGVTSAVINEWKAEMKSPHTKAQLVAETVQWIGGGLVKVDGKWYWNPFKSAEQVTTGMSIPPCPVKVDHSSKEAVFCTLLLALYHNNNDLVWECFAPAYRRTLLNKHRGSNEAVVKEIMVAELRRVFRRDMLETTIKACLFNKRAVSNIIEQQKGRFINIDGKWYLNPPER